MKLVLHCIYSANFGSMMEPGLSYFLILGFKGFLRIESNGKLKLGSNLRSLFKHLVYRRGNLPEEVLYLLR